MRRPRPAPDRRDVSDAPRRAPAGPGWGRVAAAAGLALLVGSPLGWIATRPPTTVGDAPPLAAAGAGPDGGPVAATGATVTAVAGRVDADRWPVRLELPTLGAALPVVAVGLDAAGDVAVPASPAVVGWDRRAAVAGAPGPAVLAAHVDSRTEGLGAFARLVELAVGDGVVLTDARGRTAAWRVVGRESVAKEDLPVRRLSALHGPPVLALVTCGGAFDPVARRYAENVIVWAVPVDGSGGAARS